MGADMMNKIKKALTCVKDVVVNPKRYFTKIVADGNLEESMLKAFGAVVAIDGRRHNYNQFSIYRNNYRACVGGCVIVRNGWVVNAGV